ncbi:MAG: hypothetical protein PHR96_00260 [Clostridia bacterium]|nr:hypothetical protein [Clostridia bacterium]
MIELTALNVFSVKKECQYNFGKKNSSPTDKDFKMVISESNIYYFSANELEGNREIIEGFFRQLIWTEENLSSASIMQTNQNGKKWGDFYAVADLIALGIGLKLVQIKTPDIKNPFNYSPIIKLNQEHFKSHSQKIEKDKRRNIELTK